VLVGLPNKIVVEPVKVMLYAFDSVQPFLILRRGIIPEYKLYALV
tara:strand:- start:325 stop:459 length:135 start_codon:yes stop_codon:yes gene_type:complete